MKCDNPNQHEELGVFQIVVLVLSILVLGALFVDTAFKLPQEISKILEFVDTGVCVLLLADFCVRFHKAKSKLVFMKWGWIDLLASIPNLPFLRVGRLVRILRIIRLLRAIRATHKVSHLLFRNKLHGGVASVFVSFLLLVVFSSVGILICEQSEPAAKIKTAADSIWWSVATITTVGYGDLYPVTPEGRCVAMALMISGVGMFGVVSGLIATALIGTKKENSDDKAEILERLKRLENKIDSLQNHENPK